MMQAHSAYMCMTLETPLNSDAAQSICRTVVTQIITASSQLTETMLKSMQIDEKGEITMNNTERTAFLKIKALILALDNLIVTDADSHDHDNEIISLSELLVSAADELTKVSIEKSAN